MAEYKLNLTAAEIEARLNMMPEKGDKGKSAYEYAVEGGYTGTEAEYAGDMNPTNMEGFIVSELAKRGQVEPLFAQGEEWLHENGDDAKLYVLPDGMVWANMTVKTETETNPNFKKNWMDDPNTQIKEGIRYSSTNSAFKDAPGYTAVIIQLPETVTSGVVVRVTYPKFDTNDEFATYIGTSASSFSGTTVPWSVESTGICKATVQNSNGAYRWIVIHLLNSKLIGSIDDFVITVNEEISYTTIEGGTTSKWVSTGHAFIPANYEDRVIAVEDKAASNAQKIAALESKSNAANSVLTMYISPTGNDSNSGLSVSAPKKTVKACVNAGAKRISAKRGVYNERITLSDIDELEIFPTDNDYTFDANVKRYPPIVFDTSHVIPISSLTAYNSIKTVEYTEVNEALRYVFTNGLYNTVYSTTHGYHAVLWAITGHIKNDFKLRPVATVAEVEANANSFTWANNVLYLNADLSDVREIRVPTIYDNAMTVFTANKVKLTDVEIRFAGRYSILIENCPSVEMDNCSVKYSSNGSGFDLKNVNGTLRNCYASRVHDGYGIGDYGHTIFIDCVAEWCFDDGMSHHRGCTGTVIGGRYEGNGKAGNCPAHGASVNIYGGLYKDNGLWGIAYWYENNYNPCTGMVQGAVMVNNPKGLVVDAESCVTAVNCHYVRNGVDKDIMGTLVEY